jgi:hypothetical protein
MTTLSTHKPRAVTRLWFSFPAVLHGVRRSPSVSTHQPRAPTISIGTSAGCHSRAVSQPRSATPTCFREYAYMFGIGATDVSRVVRWCFNPTCPPGIVGKCSTTCIETPAVSSSFFRLRTIFNLIQRHFTVPLDRSPRRRMACWRHRKARMCFKIWLRDFLPH